MSKLVSIVIIVIAIISLTFKRKIVIESKICLLKINQEKNDGAVVFSPKASLTASYDNWERQSDVIDNSQLNFLVIDEIVRQCEANDFPIETIMAIARCESGFNPNAKNKSSSASGVLQFTRTTFLEGIRRRQLDWTWEDVFDYKKNIDMGIWFIKQGEISRWNASKNCWK